jgi:hypothetical protein
LKNSKIETSNPWDKYKGLPPAWVAEKIEYSRIAIYTAIANGRMSKRLKESLEWLDDSVEGWRPIDTVNKLNSDELRSNGFSYNMVMMWKKGLNRPTKKEHVQKLYEIWEQ